jgi:Multi-copper polyphenol oxidoreductase laccase
MVFPYSTYNDEATIVLYGGKDGDPTPFAQRYTHSRDRVIDYTILPPSDHRGEGFKQIVTVPTGPVIKADGLLLPPMGTATIRSKDCPIVFIKNTTTGLGVLLHAGRAAMTPDELGRNVITEALSAVTQTPADKLIAYIRAGICQQCFVHDMRTDIALVAPFWLQYYGAVDGRTGGIDLIAIIVTQLRQAGLHPDHIDHDGLCTYEHDGLSSHRRKDLESNLVLVLNH